MIVQRLDPKILFKKALKIKRKEFIAELNEKKAKELKERVENETVCEEIRVKRREEALQFIKDRNTKFDTVKDKTRVDKQSKDVDSRLESRR